MKRTMFMTMKIKHLKQLQANKEELIESWKSN